MASYLLRYLLLNYIHLQDLQKGWEDLMQKQTGRTCSGYLLLCLDSGHSESTAQILSITHFL